MTQEHAVILDLEEQIDRCRRLAKALTDETMRTALEDLAQRYEREFERRKRGSRRADNDERNEGFMLRPDEADERREA